MKVVYTESAEQELNSFHNRQQKLLEDLIENRKFVFGDKVVEITASDIRLASRYIQPLNVGRSGSTLMRRFILQVNIIGGVLIALIGFFYPNINKILSENPSQVILVAVGVMITMLSLLMHMYFRYRDERRRQMLDVLQQEHKARWHEES